MDTFSVEENIRYRKQSEWMDKNNLIAAVSENARGCKSFFTLR